MICKEFDELTPQERVTFIGRLVHAVQNSSGFFYEANRIITNAALSGLFDNVIINPSIEEQQTNKS